MSIAGRAPVRAFICSLAVVVPLLVAATPASGAVVINEVESQPADFVELYNNGGSTVDIGNWTIDDVVGSGGAPSTIPGGTMLLAGAYYVENAPPGLGNPDEVHLFDNAATEIDSFSYLDHARNTYGRCP